MSKGEEGRIMVARILWGWVIVTEVVCCGLLAWGLH